MLPGRVQPPRRETIQIRIQRAIPLLVPSFIILFLFIGIIRNIASPHPSMTAQSIATTEENDTPYPEIAIPSSNSPNSEWQKKLSLAKQQISKLGKEANTLRQENAELHDELESCQSSSSSSPSSGSSSSPSSDLYDDFAIVLFCYQRPAYLTRSLDSILKHRPSSGFHLFISQDGDHPETAAVAQKYASKHARVTHIQHDRNSASIPSDWRASYHAIAGHYNFALKHIFSSSKGIQKVIILEEDLEISPDFYSYMSEASKVMDEDDTIWTVSAWNDQGLSQYTADPLKLHRSDFFPGLGWIMSRTLWNELGPKWPEGFWDDWMREPPQRKGRVSIRPEVSRTYTFGKEGGASAGQFFDSFLGKVRLNRVPIDFSQVDLSYLQKDRYDTQLEHELQGATLVSTVESLKSLPPVSVIPGYEPEPAAIYKTVYSNPHELAAILQSLGLMDETKAGVPRAAYKGVVSIRINGNRVYLTPRNLNEPGY